MHASTLSPLNPMTRRVPDDERPDVTATVNKHLAPRVVFVKENPM
jgi:hypothetical protein